MRILVIDEDPQDPSPPQVRSGVPIVIDWCIVHGNTSTKIKTRILCEDLNEEGLP